MGRNRLKNTSQAKRLHVLLDGPVCAGKSALVHRLTSGKYCMAPGTIGARYAMHSLKVNGINFHVRLYDLVGLDRISFLRNPFQNQSDIILECFDISNPRELDGVITSRIPDLHTLSKPILLVGLKSDLRQDSSEVRHSLFPHEFGPCLAHLVGAVKYMECSAKTNQGVQEVFEEAIRASYENSCYFGIFNDNLKGLLLSKICMDENWKPIIEKVDPLHMPPTTDPKLKYHLERLERQLCTSLSNGTGHLMSCVEAFVARRSLAIDTFRLANCDLDTDFLRVKYSKPGMMLWSSDRLQLATGTGYWLLALIKSVSVIKSNIAFISKENCSSITTLFGSSPTLDVESIVIISCIGTLKLDFLSTLKGLQSLIIIDTAVDLSKLTFSSKVISSLKCLILNECQTDMPKIPDVLGMLSQLEVLDVTCSSFRMLPESLCLLDNLRTLRCNYDQIVFPPRNVLRRSAQEVVEYLKAFHEEQDEGKMTAHREAKIMVVGQNDVGKSTLVKSLKRTSRVTNTTSPPKTESVDISNLKLPKYNCKVYDLAGDVEYLNTHALFSSNCLHLAVFDLSRSVISKGIRSSDLFSRLELWLRTIACQDPNSYAIIVGTKMDLNMLNPQVLTDIRDRLNELLGQYTDIHNVTSNFVDGCLLCEKMFDNDDSDDSDDSYDIDDIEVSDDTEGNDDIEGIDGIRDIENISIDPEDSDPNQPGTAIPPNESNENLFRSADVGFAPENRDDKRFETTSINATSLEQSTYEDSGSTDVPPEENETPSAPHILGIFDVSGRTNKNVRRLKRQLQKSIKTIKQETYTENISRKWLAFRDSVKKRLSTNEELAKQPILKLSQVYNLAYESQIYSQSAIAAMLRFFHAEGDFLWYEDFPMMKDVVILDPQWLSNQLKSLISKRAAITAIREGILHHSMLPKIWSDTSSENRSRLITLFRNVGLCFSVSEMEDLFPSELPIGWPNREIWPRLPRYNESQTSLLFSFNFIPPSFFPDLIVAINEKRESFRKDVQPLYYRFNVVYITLQDVHWCPRHNEERQMENAVKTDSRNGNQKPLVSHRIHLELMPYKNSMKVTVRGPRPCCMISDIETTIESMKSRRYPGISYVKTVVCPECEMRKLESPCTWAFDDSNKQLNCRKGHEVIGGIDDIVKGKKRPPELTLPDPIIVSALEDHVCPKLFAVLPINPSIAHQGLSLKNRFVYSILRDGFAVHLLCEAPEEWHFVSSPGFRVGKPKEFFKKHGKRVCTLLRVISALGAPFQIASAIDPHCRAGVAAAGGAERMRKELKGLLDDYLEKYHLEPELGSPDDDEKYLKSSDKLSRKKLSQFLEVSESSDDGDGIFSSLACMYVDRCNDYLWLCENHIQQYSIINR